MVTRSLTRLGGIALDLIYPPRCVLCDRHGAFICEGCLDSLPRADGDRCDVCWLPLRGATCPTCLSHPSWLKALRSLFRFEGEARRLVHAFKFRGHSALGRPLAALLAKAYQMHGLDVDVITAVPLTGSRKRQRGYNQSALLARELARAVGVPYADVLLRVGNAAPQAQIADAEERRRNVLGAFDVAPTARVQGLRVLVVDDVATTGATLNQCAETLIGAGATAVYGLTLARAD